MKLRPFATLGLVLGLSSFGACGGEEAPPMSTGTLPVSPAAGGSTTSGAAGQLGFPAGTGSSAVPMSGIGSGVAGRGATPPTTPTPGPGGGALPPTTPGAPGPGGGAVPPGPGATPPAAGGGTVPAPVGMALPPATDGMMPSMLPTVKGECPMLVTGPITVNNVTLQAWVGQKVGEQGGPLIIYWHGTNGSATTAMRELDRTLVSEVMASGGAIVSMESGKQGNPIDWGVFTVGDFEIVDQVVACAVQQLNIDVRRIYTSGASAGGLAAGTLAYARSNYVAGSFPNSGGVAPWPGLNIFKDAGHIPAIFTMHGAKDVDVVVIDFGDSSLQLCRDAAAKGGFAVDCDHGKGHVAAPADLKAAAWTFMKAHPYGIKPSPYAGGLPAGFPTYCKIVSM